MADASELIMKRNNLTNQDVDWLVPHQANKRIIDATASRMNLEESKVLMNIEKYGNTTSTLPLVLYDFEHLFKGIQLFWLLLEEVSRGVLFI
jgi:3-oxoacyl-[acyl-carrier-protein] synthase-3